MYRPVLSRGKHKGTDHDNEAPKSRASYATKHSNQKDLIIYYSQVPLHDKGFPASISLIH